MIRYGIILALLAGCSGAAQGAKSERSQFINAVHAAGCKIDSDAEAEIVETQTGLSQDDLARITDELWDDGLVKPAPEGGFILKTGPCANA